MDRNGSVLPRICLNTADEDTLTVPGTNVNGFVTVIDC